MQYISANGDNGSFHYVTPAPGADATAAVDGSTPVAGDALRRDFVGLMELGRNRAESSCLISFRFPYSSIC